MAQQAPADQSATAAPQRVEITGSSIKRIDGESAAPVQVMKREDIEHSGVTSVEQLMQNVASMVSSGSVATSSASGATTGGISTISLRGLSSDRTLVLINGKRTAPYGEPNDSASVDVDSIPVAAIERVEILKDGASAIYGSDAIAGVVNFILRKDYQGLEVNGSYGAATQDGKGYIGRGSIIGGIGNDRYNVMGLITFQKDGALYGADRDFSRTSIRLDKLNATPSGGADPGNISFTHANPNLKDSAGNLVPNGASSFSGNPDVDAATGTANCGTHSVYVPEISSTRCLFDTAPYVTLLPDTKRFGAELTGHYNLNDASQIYAELSYTKKEVHTVIQPAPLGSNYQIPFIIKPGSPIYPTAYVTANGGVTTVTEPDPSDPTKTVTVVNPAGTLPNVSVQYRPFIVGNRDLTDTGEAMRGVIGIQGTAAGWDYDASALLAESKVTEKLNGGYYRIEDDGSLPGIESVLNAGLINPFDDSANGADAQKAAQATNFIGTAFTSKPKLYVAQGKASRDLMPLGGGSLALALGAEARHEVYTFEADPALATGNISGYGGNLSNIGVGRSVYGLFGEVDAPLTKKFEVDGAIRYDRYQSVDNPLAGANYDDTFSRLSSLGAGDGLTSAQEAAILASANGNAPSFGKATGKLGGRFKVSDQLLFRGTYSTGFRAPALTDLFSPLQAGVTAVINDPVNCRNATTPSQQAIYCGVQFSQYSGGNSALKPEESRSGTLGLVVEPTKNMSLGLDYFDTHVKNLIQVNAPDFMLANEAQYTNQIQRGSDGEIVAIDQRLTNIGEVHIAGLDVDFQSRWTLPFGRLGFNWSGTYMAKWNAENPDGSWSGSIGQTSGAAFGFIPRMRHTTTLSLATGPWVVSADYNWESGATDICGNQDDSDPCYQPHVSPYETLDAQVLFNGVKNLQLGVGVRNLFDHDPPYVNGAGGAFQAGYDPTVADPRGRFLYLNANYKFF